MYHPAPAVKREHFCHVKSHRCIAQAILLQITLCCTDQAALFGPVHRFCRAGQRAFRTGLDLTDDNGPIWLLHHNIQLTHPGVEVMCQQPAALLLIPAGRSSFSPAPCLGAVHFPFSGQ